MKKPVTSSPRRSFCTVYRHYRTGKLMVAAEYGYAAWPLGSRKRK